MSWLVVLVVVVLVVPGTVFKHVLPRAVSS